MTYEELKAKVKEEHDICKEMYEAERDDRVKLMHKGQYAELAYILRWCEKQEAKS